MRNSIQVQKVFEVAGMFCHKYRNEFVTPEHLLYSMVLQSRFDIALADIGLSPHTLERALLNCILNMEQMPEDRSWSMELSALSNLMMQRAYQIVMSSEAKQLEMAHLTKALLTLDNCMATYLLKRELGEQEAAFLAALISEYADYEQPDEEEDDEDTAEEEGNDWPDDEEEQEKTQHSWQQWVTCLNDTYPHHNPLIGREKELERTIQVLCRKEKNNPLHVGEPGVGKTALVYGLAQRISEDDRVPPRLKGSRIYQLDLGTLLAGTQYRGDMESRLKQIMDGAMAEGKAIIYIDEIHNLVGAGAIGESSMDASNLLKPYLESGSIRFIGSTTYEEHSKHMSRAKGLVRRFQQIDIAEPTVEEAINILMQLRPGYEQFHQVVYEDEALRYAVEASDRYVSDRFLPDKAIDLMDEAGAAMEAANRKDGAEEQVHNVVTRAHISKVLTKTCKIEAQAMKDDDNTLLSTLQTRMLTQIYGQNEAISQVVNAVQMAKAGLTDDDKPMASLLFVGPTGVGKTEVARVLAHELGIELVRFDMSEYTEKHTVAKLIGSPAGYVGYEDGGLLTDAIRRAPNCVLLLDEIEKAHQDIYNILLQVMDYARLTDNKGRKADFRHVVLIMTSNAGAQHAAQAGIGFGGGVSKGEAMLHQVKRTFKPEFINRLSGTITFRDMDEPMATLILRKKLSQLEQKLQAQGYGWELTDAAMTQLLKEGFTREYGAREMDRVIAKNLKQLLAKSLLYDRHEKGSTVSISYSTEQQQYTLSWCSK